MTTITETPAAAGRSTVPVPEQRIVLQGISWETYRKIQEEVGDIPTLMAYNRGVLELMSPGYHHEDYKMILHHVVLIVAEELGIPCKWMGSTTFNKEEARRGLEPDTCYMLTAEMAAAVRQLPKDATPPRPDLAIEIDMRRGGVNRAEIYASLGVPEVWRFDGKTLRIDRLRDDGTYEPAAASAFLPIDPAEVARWVLTDVPGDDIAWLRAFRAWVRAGMTPP